MATTWGPGGGTHRRGERNRARRACGDNGHLGDHLGVSVRPRKPPARAHGACRPRANLALNQEKSKQILSGGQDRPLKDGSGVFCVTVDLENEEGTVKLRAKAGGFVMGQPTGTNVETSGAANGYGDEASTLTALGGTDAKVPCDCTIKITSRGGRRLGSPLSWLHSHAPTLLSVGSRTRRVIH